MTIVWCYTGIANPCENLIILYGEKRICRSVNSQEKTPIDPRWGFP